MAPSPSLISSFVSYVVATGDHLSGRQALAHWARSQPPLTPFSIGELVGACREAGPGDQDRLLGALLAVADNDQLAQPAIIAALSRRLAGVVSAWRRGGASISDLAVLQVDVVSGCWAAVANATACLAAGHGLLDRPSDACLGRLGSPHALLTPLAASSWFLIARVVFKRCQPMGAVVSR